MNNKLSKLVLSSLLTLVLAAVLLLVVLRVVGVDPQDGRPGLWLSGESATADTQGWAFASNVEEIFVQTHTPYLIPHSVTTWSAVHEGQLYLGSTYSGGGVFPDARAWNRNVIRDPRVRIKIGEQVFDQRLRYIDNPELKASAMESFLGKYPQVAGMDLNNMYLFVAE